MVRFSVVVVTLLAVCMPLPGEQAPPAGKSDTFAQDAYLRRNVHPMTVKLIAARDAGGKNVPVTFGVGCGEGDYPVGKLCPVLNGKALPAQVDVRATWPKDGSIRHAIVSLIAPSITPGKPAVLTFAAKAPPAPAPFRLAALIDGLAVNLALVAAGDESSVSSIGLDVVEQIRSLLSGKTPAGKLAPRLAGPVCYEFEISDVPDRVDDKPDPNIDVFYRLWFYSGCPAVRVACVVENTRLPAKPYPKKFTVTDRDFKSVVLAAFADGAEPVELFHRDNLTHWYQTRYRLLGWVGEPPAEVFAKQSVPYLTYAQFFPKLDFNHPVEGKLVDQGLKIFASRGYDPVNAPQGQALKPAPVHRHMPGTGGRPDIGGYPVWTRLALASESPKLHKMALAADGNGLASFPIHRREAGTLIQGGTHTDPIVRTYAYYFHGRRNAMTYRRSKTACRHHPDHAHTPSAAYYGYLTTGEKYYEEEMAFWGMFPAYVHPWNGVVPGPTRARAWQLRNVTDAAFLLPDSHPRKTYLIEFVGRSLGAFARNLAKNGHLFMGRQRKCSGRPNFVCSSQASMWQYTWLLWSLDNTFRKGWPAAGPIRDGGADLLLRIYEGTEEFKAPNGKTYRYLARDAIPYSIAIDLRQVEFLDSGQEKDTILRDITDNTGAMYYYTMVNMSNGYSFYRPGSRGRYDAWKAKLPRKVMRPEDWKLDPKVERRGPGQNWQEMANAECSAALARYDSPRAQKMYEYIRNIMDNTRRKKPRIRGIEYVR